MEGILTWQFYSYTHSKQVITEISLNLGRFCFARLLQFGISCHNFTSSHHLCHLICLACFELINRIRNELFTPLGLTHTLSFAETFQHQLIHKCLSATGAPEGICCPCELLSPTMLFQIYGKHQPSSEKAVNTCPREILELHRINIYEQTMREKSIDNHLHQ